MPRLAATIAGEVRGFVAPGVAHSIGRALVSLCPIGNCSLVGVVICPSPGRENFQHGIGDLARIDLEPALLNLRSAAQLSSAHLIVSSPPTNETPCAAHGWWIGLRREQCWRTLQQQEALGWSFDWLANFRMDVAFFDPERLLTPLHELSRRGSGVYVPGNHAKYFGLSTTLGWPISDHFAIMSRESGAMDAFMPQHCTIRNQKIWYDIPEDKLLYQLNHFNITIHRGFFPWVLVRESLGSRPENQSVDAECFRHRACCVMAQGLCQAWPACPPAHVREFRCKNAFPGHACVHPTLARATHRCPTLV